MRSRERSLVPLYAAENPAAPVPLKTALDAITPADLPKHLITDLGRATTPRWSPARMVELASGSSRSIYTLQ